MRSIRERTTYLETLDACYIAFARLLHNLAQGFEREEILLLIKQYLEEKQ